MRCSNFKVYHAVCNPETENDDADCRIHREFKNHNWLLKKINSQRKTARKEESPEREMKTSLKVSIPSEIYYSRKNRIVHDNTDDKTSKISEKKLSSVQYSEKSDLEDITLIYYEVEKDGHDMMAGPRTDDQFKSHINSAAKNNDINNKETKSIDQDTFIRTVKVSERAKNPSSTMFMNEQKCIKHNLPLPAIPEREKYRTYKTKQIDAKIVTDKSGLSVARSPMTIRPPVTNAETQTDSVIIILEEEKEILDFLKTNNITVEQITKRFSRIYCDAETSTDNESSSIIKSDPKEPEESESVKQAMACSQINKNLLISHAGFCANAYHTFHIPERVPCITDTNCSKGENLQKIVERLRPSPGEIQNDFNSVENRSNNMEQRAAEEQKSVIKRRRVSQPVMPQQNYSCSEKQTIANQHAAAARKPHLRDPRCQHNRLMSSQSTYEQERYHHHTAVAEGANYVNPNVSDNRMQINQYQYPRPQQSQVSYNARPRMMHQYAIQYTREQITQYPGMRGERWNYPQHYSGRPTMMQQPLTGDVVPTHTMPNGQQVYRQRNAVHMSLYTDPIWDQNIMRNNGM